MKPWVEKILIREGRTFVDHPADRGGPTKFGITLRTLARWRRGPVTAEDVANLTEEEAVQIYEQEYLKGPGIDRILNPQLQDVVLDCAVNHGPDTAVTLLQRALGVDVDGILGPQTEKAVNNSDPVKLALRVLAHRVRFFGAIVTRDPKLKLAKQAGIRLQAENALGWLDRAADQIEELAS